MKTKTLTKKMLFGTLLMLLILSPFLIHYTVYANGDEDEEEEETSIGDGEHEEEHEHDEDNDHVDDEKERENERELEIEVSTNEVKIESRSKNVNYENEYELKLITGDDGVKFKFEFSNEINDTESELEFKVRFTEIVEYIDVTGDNVYNETLDQAVQIYELTDFQPIDYFNENQSGMIVHIFTVTTSDGVFTTTVYVIGEFGLINGTFVAPNEVKIDIKILNFPYNSTDSALALKVKLESEMEVDVEKDEHSEDEENGLATDDEKEVEISTGNYTGFFAWAKTAIVDGIEKPVLESELEAEVDHQKFYLNYPRGELIIHDPKIGVSGILILDNNVISSLINGYTAIIGIITLTMLMLVVISRKRR